METETRTTRDRDKKKTKKKKKAKWRISPSDEEQLKINSIAAGSIAGIVSTIFCHPLDTIRTRIQTAKLKDARTGTITYRGPMHCARETVYYEGVGALYKGIAGPLAAQGVYKAVMFGSYGFAKDNLVPTSWKDNIAASFFCGMFAGTANSFVVCPVELVRNRLMVQRDPKLVNPKGLVKTSGNDLAYGNLYKGSWDCIVQTVKTEKGGIFALWKGLSSTLLRDGPGVGMWFASFELSRRLLPQILGIDPDSSLNLLLSGSIGGFGFWSVALPFDAIKSNLQTIQRPKVSFLSIIRETGITGLYSGFSVALLRGIPGAGVVFFVQRRALGYLNETTNVAIR